MGFIWKINGRHAQGRRGGAAAIILIAATGVWPTAAAGLTDADASLLADEPLEDPIDTEFGSVQYDNRASCGAEVAYVVNRVLVQSTKSVTKITSEINTWLATAPPMAAATSATVTADALALAAPKARKVDEIKLPVVHDDEPSARPVWAFTWGGDRRDVVALSRHLIALGSQASPDYVTLLADGHNFFKPDGIPQPAAAPPVQRLAAPAQPPFGSGVRVHVYDSGLAGPANSTLIPNVRRINAVDTEVPDRFVTGAADHPTVGHGRAISSLIATLSPGTEVWNARVTRSGISTDFSSAKRIVATFKTPRSAWPDILVTSFGTQACDLVPNGAGDEIFPVSLNAASDAVDRLSDEFPVDAIDMLIVASAGNHGTDRRLYPAGFDNNDAVVAVGALNATLDADGDALSSTSRTAPLADFSARGDWIDFYAPGFDLVTLHVDGIKFTLPNDDGSTEQSVINGQALVRGTSFSGPYVGGLLAELMATNGGDASAALTTLTNAGVTPQAPCDDSATVADLGPGRAVALSTPQARATSNASAPPKMVC